ncbi:hypothetical protein CEXT_750721 [Caerostris extrusa]|uniref:Uncharacterized protein n=1 Tax=Caerostris extrusa TaxID=172846 RepID=A0AAV4TEH7_CAEEX|nr:hypothetical protein CEXT_750721 [Caerostris extrusa]
MSNFTDPIVMLDVEDDDEAKRMITFEVIKHYYYSSLLTCIHTVSPQFEPVTSNVACEKGPLLFSPESMDVQPTLLTCPLHSRR